MDMELDIQTKRELIEKKMRLWQTIAFEYWLDAQAIMAQDPGPDPEDRKAKEEEVQRLLAQSRNAQAAARRMKELLDELLPQ